MASHEKEARRPFLHGDGSKESGDDAIELPELNHRSVQHERGNDNGAMLDCQLDQPSFENYQTLCEPTIKPRKSATHAILFMLAAQIFSASMNVSIRLLENASTHLHPLQILFVRMSITTVGITSWLCRQKKPNNILGKQENRPLLLLRAFGGFLGVFGLYYSLKRLQLSEATVITFMTPLVASFGGYLLLGSPFSWLEILLSIISLFGVLLVASADGLFPAARTDVATNDLEAFDFTSRIWAICAGLVGVCGSAAAFLCMSFIGKTEGPLTVVNYFAALCALVSFIMLVALPGLSLQAPGGVRQWGLLFFSGLSGFLMQLLITMALQAEKSMVAVNMVYTQIVFALLLDATVFHNMPDAVSLTGCALICGSALFLAWHKTKARTKANSPENGYRK